ncbi:MAG: hypothetical protein FJ134_16380 [Deltaproteobacteria bacterium]|nr:hypothetical protein [Deltaproteobacteria bacterium]
MTMKAISYEEARPLMKPGDVIAFGGKGQLSEIIKFATHSAVSHVGVILQTKVVDDLTGRFFNQIIESTSLHGFNGVTVSRFSDRLTDYDGEIWWLPLSQGLWQQKFDRKAFYDFLFNQAKERKPYDMPQAINSALDHLDSLPGGLHGANYNKEDFSRFFCSELAAAGLEKSGAIPRVNASEVTPIDLCRWNIYDPEYYLLKGDDSKRIKGFNSLAPGLWDI